jgi:hypothetical protein
MDVDVKKMRPRVMDNLLPYQRRLVEWALAAEAKPKVTYKRFATRESGCVKPESTPSEE